jgi:hypothetical protein
VYRTFGRVETSVETKRVDEGTCLRGWAWVGRVLEAVGGEMAAIGGRFAGNRGGISAVMGERPAGWAGWD